MKKNKKRIGLLGGTFDPIHYGHLILAEECRNKFNLEEVIFIPSAIPPHKKRKITSAKHRYKMVSLAIKENEHFSASNVELKRKEISFTYKTIQYFNEKYGECDLFFILGIDSVIEIGKWKTGTKILELCSFIAATRPGYKSKDVPLFIRKKVKIIKIVKIGIASAQIRNRLKEKQSIKYLVPAAVEKYIYKNRLYE